MVDFGAPSGPEQAGQRPAILMQEDAFTQALTTIIVIPLTTNLKRKALPTTVFIPAGDGGLPRDSVALCHQIRARGKIRLLYQLGTLTDSRFDEVVDRLLTTIGL